MDVRIPPLYIKILLESNPLKSRILEQYGYWPYTQVQQALNESDGRLRELGVRGGTESPRLQFTDLHARVTHYMMCANAFMEVCRRVQTHFPTEFIQLVFRFTA